MSTAVHGVAQHGRVAMRPRRGAAALTSSTAFLHSLFSLRVLTSMVGVMITSLKSQVSSTSLQAGRHMQQLAHAMQLAHVVPTVSAVAGARLAVAAQPLRMRLALW